MERPGRSKKARNMQHELSQHVVYYGNILGPLAHHHPQYAALAWGALKFALMSIINHAEHVEETALALTNIGYALRQAAINDDLYHTDSMKEAFTSLYDIITFFIKVARIQAFQRTILRGVQFSFQDIQPSILDLQYRDILAALKPTIEPAEVLYVNQLLMQRRKSKWGLSYNVSAHTANLNEWAKSPSSSLLVLQPHAGADLAAKEISVDIITHLRAANKPIFWRLSELTNCQSVISTETILKTLLFQVTKAMAPETLLSAFSPQGLTVANTSASHSEHEWLEILKRSIVRLAGDCFIVVECPDLYQMHAGQPQWAQVFLELFHTLVDGLQGSGSRVKVLVVNSDKSGAGWRDLTYESPRVVMPLQRSALLPPKARKTGIRSAQGGRQPASLPPRALSTTFKYDGLTVTEEALKQEVQVKFQRSSDHGPDGNVSKGGERTSPNEKVFRNTSSQTEENTQLELQMAKEGGMELQPPKDTNPNVENEMASLSEGETGDNEYLGTHESGKEQNRWTVLSIAWGVIQRSFRLAVSILILLGYLEPECDSGRHRVRWACRCGRHFYYDFDESTPDEFNTVKDRLKRSGAIVVSNNTQGLPDSRGNFHGIFSFLAGIFSTRYPYENRGERGRDAEFAQPTEQAPQFEAPGSSMSTKHILSCTHSGLYGKLLHQENIVNVKSDRMLFEFLRKLWMRNRGKLQGAFSLRTVRGIRFVKFHLRVGSDVEILHHQYFCRSASCNCLPPASLVSPQGNEYDYSPVLSPSSYPPFSPDWLMHKLVSPNCIHPAETEVLNQVPKRICGKLEAQPGSKKDGWGIFFEEGWDFLRIALVLLSIFTCSLIFGIAWSVSRHDTSGGFAVSAWIVSVGALMVAFVALKDQSI